MGEPIADIKVGLRIWKYLGIAKETWEQIVATPKQLASLQARLAELETRLQRCPGEGCPHCGKLTFRIEETKLPMNYTYRFGAREHHWLCGECGYKDVRTYYPSNMPKK